MLRHLLVAAVAVGVAASLRQTDDPRAVILAAQRALEGDSAAAVRAGWERRLRRDPGDRGARLGLATLDRLTYDYEASERHHEALTADDPRRDDPHGAYARFGRGYSLMLQGRFDDATAVLDSTRVAAAAAGVPALVADILVTEAANRPATARTAMLDSALALAAPGDERQLAELLCRRALLDRAIGWEPRLAAADSGIALSRRVGPLALEGTCVSSKATVLLERGETTEPIRLLVAADSLLSRARHQVARANVLYRLGYRYVTIGQHGRAMTSFRTGAALADRLDAARFSIINRIGMVQTALVVNDLAMATDVLAEAKAIAARIGDTNSLRFVRLYEAEILLASGEVAAARRRYEAMLPEMLAEEGAQNGYATLTDLTRIATDLGDGKAAEAYLARARAYATEHRLDPALVELAGEEGYVALGRGDLARAERRFGHALEALDSARHSDRYAVRVRLAEVHALQGDLARAEGELRAAGAELDRWRATLEDEGLRLLSTEVTQNGGVDPGVPRVLAALAAGGRTEAAFDLAERRRARELVTRMTQAEAMRDDAPASGGLRARVARQGEPATWREVAAALPDDRTALLEYVVGAGDTPTTLFVVTRGGVRAFRLPAVGELAGDAARLLSLIEDGDRPDALARSLGAALLDSAVAALGPGVERLVVVPDGALHRIPFDVLRLADDRYALERFTVSTAPSATVARELWRRGAAGATGPAGERTARILAMGDPAFGAPASTADSATGVSRGDDELHSAFASAGGLARLAGAGREARLVARYADGEARVGDSATEAALKRGAAGYDVLHLATHAVVDDRTVARTAIALAPGDGEDGFVVPGDLAALELDADLVVLSACRTAGGVLLGGEGVWGLTGPLLQAGARAVVATSWRIGDEESVRLVEDFYAELADGRTVADALRAAKLAALGRGASPREWAAFTIVGDPTVTVPLRRPARWPVTLLGAAGGLAVLGAVYSLRTRRRRTVEPR